MYWAQYKLELLVVVVSIIASYLFLSKLNVADINMANNGLLFISKAAKIHNACKRASKFIRKVLYIKINGNTDDMLPVISKQIVNLYSKATTQCSNLDVRLMLKPSGTKPLKPSYPVDLILYDSELKMDVAKLKGTVPKQNCQLESVDLNEEKDTNVHLEPVKTYEYVALGGTFDRLHNGHKILLSQAVLRATKHVTVGVTDVNMIQSKKLFELIEPVETRIKSVLDFLTDINPELEYNVLPLRDLYGPTKDDPKFQLIVVSEETVRGAVKINEKRKENGLNNLDMYVIGLAEDQVMSKEEENKVSSSNKRMRLLGTVLKEPVPNPNIPARPYVIGLAGGIASGKSNIAERLKQKGAAIVNCDFIAHDLYKPGLPLNKTLEKAFGPHIITKTGEVDRRQLGQIVFSDKGQLERLNQILWPAILEEAKSRIRALGQQGYDVVVMEAAVMVRAEWYRHCHQLWSVIIPPEEAIKRMQKRNNLSEEEARQRLAAQPSNTEQVAPANVVFSPYWSYDYTQVQIDKAWEHLQEYLKK